MITITVDEKHKPAVSEGGSALRILCQKEVDNFDRVLRQRTDEYRGGLSKFERLAVEGYLYQKLRGRLDETPDPEDLP